MDSILRNAIKKVNVDFNYAMEVDVSRTPFQPWFKQEATHEPKPWYVKIYDTAGMVTVELIERDGGIVASVMDRINMSTPKVGNIMDALLDYIPITPPGGD